MPWAIHVMMLLVMGVTMSWDEGVGWMIAGGVAECDGSQVAVTELAQDVSANVISGSQYFVQYTLTRSDGTITPDLRGTALATQSAAGTYLAYVTAGSGDANLTFTGDADFTGTVDNVKVWPWPAENIGSISSLPLTTMTDLEITAASNVAWVDGALDRERNLTTIYLDALNWSGAEVNAFFASLVVANNAGAVDCTITLTNMIDPTGQGVTDADELSADSWTITY